MTRLDASPAATLWIDALSVRLWSGDRLLRVWTRVSIGTDWRGLARGVASEVGTDTSVRVAVELDADAASDRLLALREALLESGCAVQGLFTRGIASRGSGEILVTSDLDGVVVLGPGGGEATTAIGAAEASRLQVEAQRSLETLLSDRHGIDLEAAGLISEELLRWQHGVLMGVAHAAPVVDGAALTLTRDELAGRLERSLAGGLRPLSSLVASRCPGATRVTVAPSLEGDLALSGLLRGMVPSGVEVRVEPESERSSSLEPVAAESWRSKPGAKGSDGVRNGSWRLSRAAFAAVLALACTGAWAVYATVCLRAAENELSEARQSMEQLKRDKADASDAIDKATTNLKSTNALLASATATIQQADASLQRLGEDKTRLEGDLSESKKELERARVEVERLRAVIAPSQVTDADRTARRVRLVYEKGLESHSGIHLDDKGGPTVSVMGRDPSTGSLAIESCALPANAVARVGNGLFVVTEEGVQSLKLLFPSFDFDWKKLKISF